MKQHNSDILNYIIMGTFSIILLGAIIYYVYSNFKDTQAATDGIIENTNNILSESEDAELKMYDNEEVRGDQVINFIKKQLGDYGATETATIYVKVTSVVSGVTYANTYTNNTRISDITNFSSSQYYIKPTAYFKAQVVKTANKAIVGLTFIQK